jgi:hypothetical protein
MALSLVMLAGFAPPEPSSRTSAYFDLWFKRCDPAALASMLAPDVEIINRDAATFSDREELNFYTERCREPGFGTPAFRDRREALPGTLNSQAIKGFGVLETGQQRFVRRKPDGKDRELARTRFLALWQEQGGAWRLKRLYIYDVAIQK